MTYLALIVGWYASLDTYVDHALPNIAIRSWRLLSGLDLYYSAESINFMAGVYGPLLNIANGLILWIFGGNLATSNLAGGIALFVGLAAISLHLFRTSDRDVAAVGVIMFLGIIFAVSPLSFWTRPDPFILMLVCVAVASSGLQKYGTYAPHAAVAVCIGLAVNFKAHAFIYFIPIVFRYCAARWYVSWPLMAVLSVGVFLLPFGLPSISLELYLGRLFDMVGGRTISLDLLRTVLKYSTLFLSPIIALAAVWWWARPRIEVRNIWYLGTFILSICVGIYSASVPGAGWYHLLPFVPASVDLFSKFAQSLNDNPAPRMGILGVFFLVFVIISITPQKRLWRTYDRLSAMSPVADEIRGILKKYPGKSIEMGYGRDVAVTYSLTNPRPLLAFAGNPTTVTGPSAMEMRYQGKPVSTVLLEHIRGCKTDLWLIPKAERPFAMNNYFKNEPAFWAEFQEAFSAAYERRTALDYFDVWACKGSHK
ncbi:MAG: hypothetical protein HN705_10075 [Rhodospirillales bacterium]|nr:hypothetical protein [Rhodospirillales bacterium]